MKKSPEYFYPELVRTISCLLFCAVRLMLHGLINKCIFATHKKIQALQHLTDTVYFVLDQLENLFHFILPCIFLLVCARRRTNIFCHPS